MAKSGSAAAPVEVVAPINYNRCMAGLYSLPETWRHLTKQGIETLNRLAFDEKKIFEPGEQYVTEPLSDGVGVRVSVAAPGADRADVLLKDIHKQAFPRFTFTRVHFEDGLYYTDFQAVFDWLGENM